MVGQARQAAKALLASGEDACDSELPLNAGIKKDWRQHGRLAAYTALLLATAVLSQVFFKRMTNAMPNYSWFLTQLIVVAYVPIFGVLAGWLIFSITNQALVRRFAVMGLLDSMAGVCMVLGGVRTSGPMQVILLQACIPLTVLLSMAVLKKRYHYFQFVGALTITLGIVGSQVLSAEASSSVDMILENNDPIFCTIFLIAVAPMALSTVMREVAFHGFGGDLDVNFLQFWVSVFQLLCNFLAMPVYALGILGSQQVPLAEMPSQVYGGMRCLLSFDDSSASTCGGPGERPCDDCGGAWLAVGGFISSNLLYNISMMLVIKHGSAALSFLVGTLRLPLTALAFSSPLIMGCHAVSLAISDVVSLIVIVLGLFLYQVGGWLKRRWRKSVLQGPAKDGASPPQSQALSFFSPSGTFSSPASFLSSPAGAVFGRPVAAVRWRMQLLFTKGMPVVSVPLVVTSNSAPRVRSVGRLRNDLYHKLNAASPLESPSYREKCLPVPTSPLPPQDRTLGGVAELDDDLFLQPLLTQTAPAGDEYFEATPQRADLYISGLGPDSLEQ